MDDTDTGIRIPHPIIGGPYRDVHFTSVDYPNLDMSTVINSTVILQGPLDERLLIYKLSTSIYERMAVYVCFNYGSYENL